MARPVDKKLTKDWIELSSAVQNRDFAQLDLIGSRLATTNRMVASAALYTKTDKSSIDPSAVSEQWKTDAFHYFETIPEVAQIVETTAKTVAACNLRAGFQNEKAILEATNDPEIALLLKELNGSSGDYHQIMHWMSMNLQITGDGYLIASPVYDDAGTKIIGYENWEFVSVEELKITDVSTSRGVERTVVRNSTGKARKFNFTTLEPMSDQALDANYFIARGWRRSVRHSQLSDSSLRKNLGICKLLTKLTDLINAIADSQVPAGILLVPEELSLGPVEESIDGTDAEDDIIDPLTEELIDYLSMAVEDRTSAASLAPLILRAKAEFLDKVQFIRLSRDLDAQTRQIREELLDRLAMGMDAPKEMIQGKSGLSHWSSFNIDQTFASKHAIPLGALIADFLTRSYLWPMLEKRIKDGKSNKKLEDVKHWRLIFDPSNIVARVDQATQAIKLFDRGALSEKALLEASGFELKDAKTTDERRQALILQLIETSPVTLAPVLLPLIDGLEHVVNSLPQPGEDGAPVRNQRTGESGSENIERKPIRETNTDPKAPGKRTPEPNPQGVPPAEGKDKIRLPGHPGEDTRNPTTSRTSISETVEFATLVSTLTSLCHGAKSRAVERAGSKLVNVGKKYPDIKNTFSTMEKVEIVKTVSSDSLRILKVDLEKTLTDSLVEVLPDLRSAVRSWLETHFNLTDDEMESLSEKLSTEIVETLVDFTVSTRTLVDSKFDNGLSVPDTLIQFTLMKYLADVE